MAVVALVWVLLTTPATTIPLLAVVERGFSQMRRLASMAPTWEVTAIIGVIMIGLPLAGTILALIALGRIRASWTPLDGGTSARVALWLGLLSTVAGIAILLSNLRG